MAEAVTEALSAEPSAYDSHPSPTERFAWTERLEAESAPSTADDGDAVWSLFSDRTEIEELMTQRVREAVAVNHGVGIPSGSEQPGEEDQLLQEQRGDSTAEPWTCPECESVNPGYLYRCGNCGFELV